MAVKLADQTAAETDDDASRPLSRESSPLVTLFALPKPFSDPAIIRIQTNAITSWQALRPQFEVLLLGDDEGIANFVSATGVRHHSQLNRNRHGTPLLSHAFQLAHELTQSPLLMYCNADVILREDIGSTVKNLWAAESASPFLAFGRRTDLQLDRDIDWKDANDVAWFNQKLARDGRRSPGGLQGVLSVPTRSV